MKNLKLTTLLLAICFYGKAQLAWPPITGETKPWARWWWQGSAVNTKDLTANMQDYKAVGLGGLEITPIYGTKGFEKDFIPFLSPQWMKMLDHTIKEAKRLNLGIDIANGTGWPFGGPWIEDKDASKTVVHKTYTLKSGETLKEKVAFIQEGFVRTANTQSLRPEEVKSPIKANKDLQAMALDQVRFSGELPLLLLMAYNDMGAIVNLTNKVDTNGNLQWKAPDGNWTLYALFQGLHGKMVERAAPGGEGYAIDHFSKEALQTYLKKFDEAFAGHDISYIRALFNDSYEVDDARGQSNWTPHFFYEFKKRRGYDLKLYLPQLFGKEGEEMNSRIRYDYRATIDELILEYFTQEWKKWGSSKGAIIRNQSHGSPANLLDLYSAIDIPETEGDNILRFKFATSAANVSGKKLASSESATWLNEHFLPSWGDVKKKLDLFMLGGVNHIFYHGVNYSPKAEPWPGWLFYAATHFQQTNPQWVHFGKLNEYVTRAQSFLQEGKPDNDVLVYFPIVDNYSDGKGELLQHFDGMEKQFEGSDFEKVSEQMLEKGYNFDYFSDRQMQKFSLAGTKIQTGGNQYSAILFPANHYLPEAGLEKLIQLAKGGAQILFYKSLPQDVPGFNNLTARRAAFHQTLNSFNLIAYNNIQKAIVGKGSIIVSDNLHALLKAAGAEHEPMTEEGLHYTRRINGDGYTYFINNRSEKALNKWVQLANKASAVALFDPKFGKSGLAQWRNSEKGLEVLIQLQPFETIILRTYNIKKAGSAYPYIRLIGSIKTLNAPWNVTFIDGGPKMPKPKTISTLSSWTDWGSEEEKYFSGTAKYSTIFSKPDEKNDAYLLNLGTVHETAEVWLNGKSIATLIGPNYSLTIPDSAIKSNNTLEVVVANLMANRIIYMDKKGIEWKKFYNINMSARKRENLKDGVFNASDWKPLPSGLLGPVTITPVSF